RHSRFYTVVSSTPGRNGPAGIAPRALVRWRSADSKLGVRAARGGTGLAQVDSHKIRRRTQRKVREMEPTRQPVHRAHRKRFRARPSPRANRSGRARCWREARRSRWLEMIAAIGLMLALAAIAPI